MPKLVFVSANGLDRLEVEARVGQSVLDVAHAHDIPIEGACEGSLVCSTCHVIVAEADYDRLPPPSEEEEDLLDLAYGLSATSRLGCQIVVTDKLDGLTVRLPRGSHNLMNE
ncbi:ferredoxin family 2Fe-2S iron-sulfur cluster binding protein [Govanella unica]|uniref:Ferredoxin family 2Fe-2S iron-sulfur cluster binding protein n=1 Tax=Govanella unica TaxID=2975056 RepID=A0A9X3TXK8_9PROT|nr:ferredoxin family 2Fe-2S iron-sulfur cluster binding protein [Govania unica]MDA5193559.1 ferredoxin family 2Fe-2S iron-sulfur cluster binding protein [Govania unica]